jgi:SAM-dependent methyltransferase
MTTIKLRKNDALVMDDIPESFSGICRDWGLRLNIGSGNDKRAGYVSIDNSKLVNPDLVINLEDENCLEFFRDNSVDEIICNHVLEHIHNFTPLVKELRRVCKPNAKIYIRCPFYSSWGQWNDPTHVRFFSLYTFDYFNPSNYSHECGVAENGKPMFDIKTEFNFAIGRLSFLNFIMNPLINLWKDFYVRFLAFIIPASEIRYELEVLK